MREPSRDKGRLEDIILIHSRGQQLPLAELQSVAYPTSVGHQAPSFRPLLSLSSSSLRSNSLSTDDYPLPLSEGGQVRQRQLLLRVC